MDRRTYLKFLAQQCRKHRVSVLAYCLMNNHVHLILMPASAEGLALAVGRTHWLYAQHVNRRKKRTGHLWQGRFFSCALDRDHFWRAARYVERNPVRARLSKVASAHPWSSAAAHCGAKDATEILDLSRWNHWLAEEGWIKGSWTRVLMEEENEAEIRALRRSTATGRPLAGPSALKRLAQRLGREVAARPIGRPRKRRIGK